MEFSLYGREGETLVEGVEKFKYMGRPLEQTEDDWLAVIQNAKQALRVWGG